jgi:hypothetical protein
MLALPLAAALGLTPTRAQACGGEWYPALMEREPDQRPRLIPMAEKALEQGRPIAAAGIVVRVIPHIRSLKAESSPIVARAMRVLAVALARGDGSLALEREVPDYAQGSWLGKSASARSGNLRWAVSALRAVSQDKKDDPALETELSEAMARLPELREQARDKLEGLAARDLIASPEGYAALARLRAQSGDAAGEKLALTRCKAMAKSAELCGAPSESAS